MCFGHDKFVIAQIERIAKALDHRSIRRYSADHRNRRDHRMRSYHRGAEVAGDRIAESAQHFGGAVTLLLCVDHV